MSNPNGRPRIYETLNHINVGVTNEERSKLDQLCSQFNITRHEYLSSCLNYDSNDGNRVINDAELKQKEAEIYSLKKEIDSLKKDNEQLKERLTKLGNKKSKKDAKLQIKLEDIKKRCKSRIETCINNVGEFDYQRGTRDQYHSTFMQGLAEEYKLLKLEGGENAKDDYLERELAKWL